TYVISPLAREITLLEPVSFNSEYRRSLLEGLELFKGVSPGDVREQLQRCHRRDLVAGEILLSPGIENDRLYIILSGSLNVHVGSPDAEILANMEMGSSVGEMSIIEDRDPSAYVIAAEDTHMLVIPKSVLWEMVDASHQLTKNLLVVLSERVRRYNHVIADNYGEIRKFERHATTDALTSLANRHAMQSSFPEEVESCIKNEQPVSLIMIDVDNFKTFNDRFGHVAGDRALSAVSAILSAQFRPDDLLVRYGGDEFAILLPGATADEAMDIAERVRQTVCGTTGDGSDSLIKVPLTVSMGIAELGPGESFDTLMRSADAALYRAKHAGRNAVTI
ncbi:MAG: GGDEF domain-containing protein, partial [Gammaproteobacteria bacterium]|nr:GGDEF domain-containing protein [Gammaproteobacteria bacterium]